VELITVDLAQFKQMDARIRELEAIVRSKGAMLDEIATAAGFQLGDTYSARAVIVRLQESKTAPTDIRLSPASSSSTSAYVLAAGQRRL